MSKPLTLALVTQTLDQGNVIAIQASGLCWPPGAPGRTSQELPDGPDGAFSSVLIWIEKMIWESSGGTPREQPHHSRKHITGAAAQRAAKLPTGLANCALISQESRKGKCCARCRPSLAASGHALLRLASFPRLPSLSASFSCSCDICSVPVPPVILCPLQLCIPPALRRVP